MKTQSQVPLLQRLAKENKEEQYYTELFNFHRLTMTYEDLKKNFNNKTFLKHFEYVR